MYLDVFALAFIKGYLALLGEYICVVLFWGWLAAYSFKGYKCAL